MSKSKPGHKRLKTLTDRSCLSTKSVIPRAKKSFPNVLNLDRQLTNFDHRLRTIKDLVTW
jgi:hypothetical protein